MNALAAAARPVPVPVLGALPLDPAALAGELGPGLRRPGLMAHSAVLVGADALDDMVQAVAVLDRVLGQGAPGCPAPGVLGFDFHLTDGGARLIEVNTNPGGLLLVLAHGRACLRLYPGLDLAALPADRAEDLAMAAFAGPARRLAIVDDAPERQFLYPEFRLYRDGFARYGVVADIVDAAGWAGGYDAVYNRLTDFFLTEPEHAGLAADRAAGRVILVPDPAAHAAFADKRRLVELSRHPDCAAWVPATFAGTDDWPATWDRRRHLFFKPVLGFGGRGGYRGDKISRATWERLDPAATVVQQLVPPPCLDDGFKVDIRAFAVGGRVLAFAARLYRGQVTNFRSPGGGLAAVFRLPAAG